MTDPPVLAIKDPDAAHPVPTAWRPMLSEIVRALVEGDLELARGPKGVHAVSPSTAQHIRSYLQDYGATLVELPPQSWETSVAQWMGDYWDVLVDLWTVEEGASDLVLKGQMRMRGGALQFTIDMVYVP